MLPFKRDFCSILEKHGRLPTTNLNTKLNTSSTLDRITSKLKMTKDVVEMTEKELEEYVKREFAFKLKQKILKNKALMN